MSKDQAADKERIDEILQYDGASEAILQFLSEKVLYTLKTIKVQIGAFDGYEVNGINGRHRLVDRESVMKLLTNSIDQLTKGNQ